MDEFEVDIDGKKYKLRDLTLEDIDNWEKDKTSYQDATAFTRYLLSKTLIEPKTTYEDAKKLPLKISRKLLEELFKRAGFPPETLMSLRRTP